MISDLFDSAKQNIIDRLSSPLLGSFVVAWSLVNWKFFVILFSDNSVTETFDLIEKISFPDFRAAFVFGFLIPMISALCYIFIYPFPAKFVYEYTLKVQRTNNEIRKRISNETPLTLEESRAVRDEANQQVEHMQSKINALNTQVKLLTNDAETIKRPLQETIERLTNEVNRLNDDIAKFSNKSFVEPQSADAEVQFPEGLDVVKMDILECLNQQKQSLPLDFIANVIKLPREDVAKSLTVLLRKKLITRAYTDRGKEVFGLSHTGQIEVEEFLQFQKPVNA